MENSIEQMHRILGRIIKAKGNYIIIETALFMHSSNKEYLIDKGFKIEALNEEHENGGITYMISWTK